MRGAPMRTSPIPEETYPPPVLTKYSSSVAFVMKAAMSTFVPKRSLQPRLTFTISVAGRTPIDAGMPPFEICSSVKTYVAPRAISPMLSSNGNVKVSAARDAVLRRQRQWRADGCAVGTSADERTIRRWYRRFELLQFGIQIGIAEIEAQILEQHDRRVELRIPGSPICPH